MMILFTPAMLAVLVIGAAQLSEPNPWRNNAR